MSPSPVSSIEDLTPRQIVAELDKFIIGQSKAKRAVAIALRNRYRRARLTEELRDEVIPKNILMIGPTGVGKTEIARRLAKLARAPFLKVEATKFTEVGYVGRDVDSMVRDLVQISVRLVEAEMTEAVKERADALAVERIVDVLQPRRPPGRSAAAGQAAPAQQAPTQEMPLNLAELQKQMSQMFGFPPPPEPPAPGAGLPNPMPSGPSGEEIPSAMAGDEYEKKRAEQEERVRQRLRQQVAAGLRDDDEIEIEIEEGAPSGPPFLQFLSPGGSGSGGSDDPGGMDLQGILGQMLPRRKKPRRVAIREARQLLAQEAARGLIDAEQVGREAVERAEQGGIIFLDEMDKIAGRGGGREGGGGGGPDVSREGVQRDLLPLIEGSTVQTKHGPVRTNFMLFIAAGAFHVSKPSDLIPELQGRLPIRVELDSLNEDEFRRILTEPKNALTRQYQALLETENVDVTFTADAVAEIARVAVEVNTRTENIGARRLHTVMERLLDELSFEAPDVAPQTVVIDRAFVRQRLSEVAGDEDLSRYIL